MKLSSRDKIQNTHLRRTYDIIGMRMRRHFGLQLLLQHGEEANNNPNCVPHNQLQWQKHIILT